MNRSESFEETLEFSNATRFRKAFLGLIDKLQANQYLRYVVTKHGEPKVVVMSFQAYEHIKQAFKGVVAAEALHDRAQAVHDAYDEMAEQYWPEVKGRSRQLSSGGSSAHADLRERVRNLMSQLQELRMRVEEAEQAPRAVLKQDVSRR